MSLSIWYTLGLLQLTALGYCEIFRDCGYRLKLQPGEGRRLRVESPNYPDPYSPHAITCLWHIISDTRINFTCEVFDIPGFYPDDCNGDVFIVDGGRSLPKRRYCGKGLFDVISTDNEMKVILRTVSGTSGGKISCFAKAYRSEDEQPCQCGWKGLHQSRPTISQKYLIILGGKETRVNEYPMMAAIVDTRLVDPGVYCGGTIISKKHVLTAAHGLVAFQPKDAGVVVGDHDITRWNDTVKAEKLFRVVRFYIHPGYKSPAKKYDIAVVLIDGMMDFANAIGPACLPFNLSPDRFEGSPVEILGWGTMMVSGALSNTLHKARLVGQNLTHCKTYYPDVDSSQICTYGEDADACQHDSGGPVLWQHPVTKRLVVIGIISYGTFCGTDEPGVNTFVGAYLDWIREVTPGVKYCQNN